MSAAVGAVLTFGVGIGISPIPIIAVILVLFSARARVNGPVFAFAWTAGLAAVATVVYLVADALGFGTDADAKDGSSWLKVGLGVVLLVLAHRKWSHRPKPGEQPTLPGWAARIDGFSPLGTAGFALALAANPKNLLLAIGAATSLADVAPTPAEAAVGLAALTLLGSLAVLAAVGYATLGGERAQAGLDDAKGWLELHNDAVMTVLFLVFAALLISQGLGLRG